MAKPWGIFAQKKRPPQWVPLVRKMQKMGLKFSPNTITLS